MATKLRRILHFWLGGSPDNDFKEATPIFCDNEGSLSLAHTGITSRDSNYLVKETHIVHQFISEKNLCSNYNRICKKIARLLKPSINHCKSVLPVDLVQRQPF
jgi:hypothetical protein